MASVIGALAVAMALLLAVQSNITHADPAAPSAVDPAAIPVLRASAVGYARHALLLKLDETLGLPSVQVRTGMRAAVTEPDIDVVTSHMYLGRLIEGVIAFDCSGAGPKRVDVIISSGADPAAARFVKRCNAEELARLLQGIALELRSQDLGQRFRGLLQQLAAAERTQRGTAGAPGSSPAPARAAGPGIVGDGVVATHSTMPAAQQALPGNVQLSWEAPRRMSNGDRLRGPIQRYRIYGTRSAEGAYEVLAEVPGNQTRAGLTVAPGTWYFAVTAVLPDGSESAYSAEVTKQVR